MRRFVHRRASTNVCRFVAFVLALVLYTGLVANVSRFYALRGQPSAPDRSSVAAVVGRPVRELGTLKDVADDADALRAIRESWQQEVPPDSPNGASGSTRPAAPDACAVRHRDLLARGAALAPCSGHGVCNATAMECACRRGYAGAACDVHLAASLRETGALLAAFEREQAREASASALGAESAPTSNRLVSRALAAKLVTVVLPILDSSTEGQVWRQQVVDSISRFYPGLPIVEVPVRALSGDASQSTGFGTRDVLTAWNEGLDAIVATPSGATEWAMLLSPSVVRFHEHTNVELMLSILLTSDVDVLGFSTLTPAVSERDGSLLQPNGQVSGTRSPNRSLASSTSPSGLPEHVFHTDCWNFHGPERWVLTHEKPLFGYSKQAGTYAMVCDRTSDSFIIRTPSSRHHARRLFNSSMGISGVTDFFLRAKRADAVVATCVECLLITHAPSAWDSTQAHRGYQRWGSHMVPPPWYTTSAISQLFADVYQVEAIVGPHRVDVALAQRFRSVPVAELERSFATLQSADRIRCTKSGGIYGHSKLGLYSPLCHRFQRQRDFMYLAGLWIHGWPTLQPSRLGKKRGRYGVSLHHGNLFGALRMGVELLWETDGDFDLISFDDSHADMMARWDAFVAYATAHAGFEVRVTYPEKPWYVAFLRDKTDFQINVRGVHSEQTRGRPPHVHNVSVYYQGLRVYVNGFQNPWLSIRSDPGHDYRRRYLVQQGWVLGFTKHAISCKVPGHPSCLPPCSDPRYTTQASHQLCDEPWIMQMRTSQDKRSGGFMPIDVVPAHLRDPLLFV